MTERYLKNKFDFSKFGCLYLANMIPENAICQTKFVIQTTYLDE